MKMYSYEITYKINEELKREYLYSKMHLIFRYIQIITDTNFDCSELKAFRNGVDITAQINRFLMK